MKPADSCLVGFDGSRQAVEPIHRRWLGKVPVLVSWLGLTAAALCPPHGTGFTICWLKAITGISCPGCGLTRSLSCGLRGMWLESWHYHPMGLLILALFVFTAGTSLLPTPWRKRLASGLESRASSFNALYVVFVVSFVAFGLARALLQLPHCSHLG